MKVLKTAITLVIFIFSLWTPGFSAEEISVVGTGSGMVVLQAVADAFNQQHPDITILVPPSIGSGGGIKTVGADKNPIGRVARELKEKEAHFGLTYKPFTKLPIVFYTHKDVGVQDVTPQQLCDIYSGKITNWKDVGGKDRRIRVIRREDGDSSLKVLKKSLEGFKDIVLTSKAKTTFTDQETLELAAKKADTIGFGTFGNARNYDVNILSINGKKPQDADYSYNGTLALIYKEKNNVGSIKAFVDFATSPQAHEAIKQAGGSPF